MKRRLLIAATFGMTAISTAAVYFLWSAWLQLIPALIASGTAIALAASPPPDQA